MRKPWALGLFLGGLLAAWLIVAPPPWGVLPLVNAEWQASGVWRLRQLVLNLSGVLSIGLMAFIMVLALRLPWMERLLGGMDQVYRLHKWAGIGAGVFALMHWGAKESGSFIRDVWSTAGRPARDVVLPWAVQWRSSAKDIGEIAYYILMALLVLTLWQRLLNYRNWRWTHRVMPVIFLALALHSILLMPQAYWAQPLGLLMAGLFAAGTLASVISLLGGIGKARTHRAHVHSIRLLGPSEAHSPLEVVCAMPATWQGHRPGQFAFVSFAWVEGAHPFTIASAPDALGTSAAGEALVRFIIKPLGDFTGSLVHRLSEGQVVNVEGPYGAFDAQGSPSRDQVWIGAGVGVTPFIALLEARQRDVLGSGDMPQGAPSTEMHYCTRDAAEDPLLPRLRQLCANAAEPVQLVVHDEAAGERLSGKVLQRAGRKPLDIWLCGPQGLVHSLRRACRAEGGRRWRLHHELFAMR